MGLFDFSKKKINENDEKEKKAKECANSVVDFESTFLNDTSLPLLEHTMRVLLNERPTFRESTFYFSAIHENDDADGIKNVLNAFLRAMIDKYPYINDNDIMCMKVGKLFVKKYKDLGFFIYADADSLLSLYVNDLSVLYSKSTSFIDSGNISFGSAELYSTDLKCLLVDFDVKLKAFKDSKNLESSETDDESRKDYLIRVNNLIHPLPEVSVPKGFHYLDPVRVPEHKLLEVKEKPSISTEKYRRTRQSNIINNLLDKVYHHQSDMISTRHQVYSTMQDDPVECARVPDLYSYQEVYIEYMNAYLNEDCSLRKHMFETYVNRTYEISKGSRHVDFRNAPVWDLKETTKRFFGELVIQITKKLADLYPKFKAGRAAVRIGDLYLSAEEY